MGRSWKRWGAVVLAVAAAFAGAAGTSREAAAQGALSIGDMAPELDVLEWVAGTKVDLAERRGKAVVVLDFFTVNDQRVPAHVKTLNGLAAKHGAALAVVGVATDTVDDAKKFVSANGFKFPVAVDNLRNSISGFGTEEPPLTVVVDKEGRVAWLGYVGEVKKILEKILAGKFDVDAARKSAEMQRELVNAARNNDPDQMEPAADALLAHDPSHQFALQVRRVCFHRRGDPKAWRDWIAQHVGKVTDSDTLNEIAWDLVTQGDVRWREPAAALAAAKKAVDLTAGKEASLVDTLARAYLEVGLPERAVETQKKAIAALEAEGTADEDDKKQYADVLAHYEACVALAKAEKPAPPPPAKKPEPGKKR